jgi:hypothetical protein
MIFSGLGQVSLTAFSWEPDKDARLIPSYTETLTTIAELGLVCGLALSPLSRAKGYVPSGGFSLQSVSVQNVNDQEIKMGLGDCGVDWLGL